MTPEELNNFRRSLQFVLKWEGGYVNNPDDPGGETKYGISKAAFPDLDIKSLTPELALQIYLNKYWVPLNCGKYNMPFCLVLLDTSVNLGIGRTQTYLSQIERSYHNGEVEKTPRLLSYAMIELRRRHYDNLLNKTSWAKNFYKGWMRRLNDLRKEVDILSEKAP